MPQKAKRILIFSTSYLPLTGGAEIAIHEITSRLPDFEFDLITSRHDNALPREEIIGNVHIYRVGSPGLLGSVMLPKVLLPLLVARKALALQRKHGHYALYFASQASQAAGGMWLAHFFSRTPYVVNIQEGKNLDSQDFLIRFFRRLIVQGSTYVTVISTYLRDEVVKIDARPERISIIPNGVNATQFENKMTEGEKINLKAKLGFAADSRIVITVSRLVEKNAVDDLLAAFLLLSPEDPRLRLLIIGEGSERHKLADFVKRHSLSDKVVFAGSVRNNELPEYLGIADVFVRPSRSEGLGIAFLEAMAAGLPVVATAAGGISDFLVNNETGFVCQPNNSESVANAMRRAFSSPEESARIVAQAKEVVRRRFSWDAIAEEYRTLFYQLLNSGR